METQFKIGDRVRHKHDKDEGPVIQLENNRVIFRIEISPNHPKDIGLTFKTLAMFVEKIG